MPDFKQIISNPDFLAASPEAQYLIVKDLPELKGASPGAIKVLLRDLTAPNNLQNLPTTPSVQTQEDLDLGEFAAYDPEQGKYVKNLLIEHLPTIGAMVAPAFGPPGMIARTALSGAGYALGGAGKRLAEGQPMSTPSQIAGDMATGSTMELVGSKVNQLIGPAVSKKAGQIGQWFAEEGLPKLGNRAASWIDNIVGTTMGGSLVRNKYIQDLHKWALGERNAILSSISEDMPIKVEAGKAVGKSVKGMFNEPKQLYEDFARMGGGDTGLIYPKSHLDRYMDRLPPGLEPEVKEAIMRGAKKQLMLRYGEEAIHPRAIETNTIHMSDATAHIAHKWNEYANPHDSALLTKIIEKRDLTVQEISQILGGKEMGIQDPSLRRLISDSIGEDLRLYDKAKGTYFKVSRDAATEAYRELANELVKNPLFINILKRYDPAYSLKVGGKRLISPSPQESSKPAYIIRDMFDTGNPEELQALKDALPKDVWNGAFANFIEDLMLKSKSYNPENKTFNPWPWQEAWTRVKPTISKVEPEVAKRIDKFTDMTVAIRDQISKEVPTFADSLSKSFATGFTGLGSMLGASFGGNKSALWAIPVMEGFGSFMAWGFLGPSGKGSFGRLVGMGTKAAIGESPMSKSLSNALDEKIKQYSGD